MSVSEVRTHDAILTKVLQAAARSINIQAQTGVWRYRLNSHNITTFSAQAPQRRWSIDARPAQLTPKPKISYGHPSEKVDRLAPVLPITPDKESHRLERKSEMKHITPKWTSGRFIYKSRQGHKHVFHVIRPPFERTQHDYDSRVTRSGRHSISEGFNYELREPIPHRARSQSFVSHNGSKSAEKMDSSRAHTYPTKQAWMWRRRHLNRGITDQWEGCLCLRLPGMRRLQVLMGAASPLPLPSTRSQSCSLHPDTDSNSSLLRRFDFDGSQDGFEERRWSFDDRSYAYDDVKAGQLPFLREESSSIYLHNESMGYSRRGRRDSST